MPVVTRQTSFRNATRSTVSNDDTLSYNFKEELSIGTSENSSIDDEQEEEDRDLVKEMKEGGLQGFTYVTKLPEYRSFEFEGRKALLQDMGNLETLKLQMDNALSAMRSLCPEVKSGKVCDALKACGHPSDFATFATRLFAFKQVSEEEHITEKTNNNAALRCNEQGVTKPTSGSVANQQLKKKIQVFLDDNKSYEVEVSYLGGPEQEKIRHFHQLTADIKKTACSAVGGSSKPPTLPMYRVASKLKFRKPQ